MSFPRYPAYKDSGVEWLGEVPEEWTLSALRHCARMRYGDALASDVRQEGDVAVYGSNGILGSHDVGNARAPAIIVGRKGSHGKLVWAKDGGFVIDTAYVIDSDTTRANLRWLFYALHPMELSAISQDTGVPGLARESAYGMRMPIPSASEQTAIATFLDRETAKIDALVAEYRTLIELLKEKRQAVISHAVTKGLDPTVPVKDSGVDWLGEVPEHWEVRRLRYVGKAIIGLTYDPSDVTEENEGTLVLRSSNIQGGKIVFDDNVYVRSSIPEKLRTLQEDILICSRNGSRALIGKNAKIDSASEGLSFGAFTTVFRSQFNAFIFYVFISLIFDYQPESVK